MNFKRQCRTRLSTSRLVAIARISLLPMPSVFAAESVSKQEVAAILDAYVEALRAGDTYGLGDLLGEKLLASRSPLRETPEYRSSLADANADTTIQTSHCSLIRMRARPLFVSVRRWGNVNSRKRLSLLVQATRCASSMSASPPTDHAGLGANMVYPLVMTNVCLVANCNYTVTP